MTQRASFWTIYRFAAVVAAFGWASGLFFVFWLFYILVHPLAPFWPFLPALVIGGLTALMMDSRHGTIHCPECGKPVFRRDGGPSGYGGRLGAGLVWPERECSQCGYDLNETGPL